MTAPKTGGPEYDERIRRASRLSAAHPFASEILSFYSHIAGFQKKVYAEIQRSSGRQDLGIAGDGNRPQLDLTILLPYLAGFLSLLESVGPPPVAGSARQLSLQGPAAWIAFLGEFWSVAGLAGHSCSDKESAEPLTEFILRAFLEPYAESVFARMTLPPVESTPRICPRCASVPVLGVLRPEGDGGKRFLLCSFCQQEWEFRRLLCPACGEETETKLPVYVAEQFPHIRVEACETCKFYLRSIDLTKDGHAVPIVDDLAAIPLSLWADEHGYTRLHPNLLAT